MPPQSQIVAQLSSRFADQLSRVRDCIRPEYVRADWADRNADLERHLLPVPPADFLPGRRDLLA
jgi:hypothetical protein